VPRNRMLTQIDDELSQARVSLTFWRDQTLLLTEMPPLLAHAERQVVFREAEIRRLLEAHELLSGARDDV
jgi:hypothetical protein